MTSELTKAITNDLVNHATITNGVIRWNSNGRVPPADCVALAVQIGLPVNVAACTKARDIDTAAFVKAYRKARKNGPSAEERAEARAAHGPGVKLVDVITAKEFIT